MTSNGEAVTETARPGAKADQRRCLILTALISATDSWVFGALFDVEMFLLSGGSNKFVGLAASIKGMTALGSAIPLGYLADCWERSKVILIAALVGIVLVVVTGSGFLFENTTPLVCSVAILALWMQAMNGSAQALMADLSSAGPERADIMSKATLMQQVGIAGGPLLQLILLLTLNQGGWSLPILGRTLAAGLVLPLFCIPVALRLHCKRYRTQSQLLALETWDQGQAEAAEDLPEWASRTTCGGKWKVNWVVALLVEGSFVINLLISGMSVNYFPLYFKKDFGFGAVAICAISVATPVAVAIVVPIFTAFGKAVGTVPGIMAATILGALFHIAFSRATNVWVAVIVYFFRQGTMKGRDPLFTALLMDCLPKSARGKWGSVAALRGSVWSGSAWIGGVFLDASGGDYRTLFLITGLLAVAVPTLILLPLLFVVPRKI